MNAITDTLTPTQQQLVSEHLDLVEKVIRKYISLKDDKRDMEWGDLYQTGCLALCHAALKYDMSKPFAAYACRSIRNSLYDYCEKANLQPSRSLNEPVYEDNQQLTIHDVLADYSTDEDLHEQYQRLETFQYLKKQQQNSSGVVQKGIYCLMKKSQGYTSADLSQHFGVKANLVRAWMSLAAKELRQDAVLHELLSR